MKKILFTLTLILSASGIFAQSLIMEEKIRSTKEKMEDGGYEIVFEDQADVDKNNSIITNEFTFDPDVDYLIILFVDDCLECKPQLTFLMDGEEYDTKPKYERDGNITKVTARFNDSNTYTGKIKAKSDANTSRKYYLLIGKNENLNP